MLRQHPRRTGAATLAVTFLLTAACGSTLSPRQQEEAEQAASENPDAADLGLPPGVHLNDDGRIVDDGRNLVTAGRGDAPDAAAGSPLGRGIAVTTAPPVSVPPGRNGPGVSEDAVSVGVIVAQGGDEANRAIGAAGATQAPMRDVWQALTHEANSAGGILGRSIVPVFHEIEAASAKSSAQQAQEACVDWTQDRPVFMTPGRAGFPESFVSCMGRAGAVISAGSAFTIHDERVYERHPYLVDVNTIDLNAQAKLLVEGLHAQGYFGINPKIGVVSFDDPNFRHAIETSLIPSLKRRGLELGTDPAYVTAPTTPDQYAQTAADARNAVLRFSSRAISHVMLLDFGGGIGLMFLPSAQQQRYEPRYGIGSQSVPTLLARQMPEATADAQFENARGVGWVPAGDVSEADEPHNNTRARCLAIMEKHGVRLTSRNAQGQAIQSCDSLWFFMAAMEASGSDVINQTTYLQGVARVERSYEPGMTFQTAVSASRHDGAGAARNLVYDAGCTCFRYSGRPYTVDD